MCLNIGLPTIFISACRNKQAKGQTKALFAVSSILNDKIDKNKNCNHFNTGLYKTLKIYSQFLNSLRKITPLGELCTMCEISSVFIIYIFNSTEEI